MSEFRATHRAAADWRHAVAHCLVELGPPDDAFRLGFLYVTDHWADALEAIVARLSAGTGIADWVGTVGLGVCGGGREYFDQGAMAVMLAALPPGSHRLFGSARADPAAFRAGLGDPTGAPTSGFGVVHADPRNPHLPALVEALAAEAGFLVGGLSASRGAHGQLAGGLVEGGISGVLFGDQVPVVTGLSQGCSPIGPTHTVTECVDNVVLGIDGRPALEVLKDDLGALATRDRHRHPGEVLAAFPIAGSDTGDYLVRNLVGVDPEKGWIATAEQPADGDRILFCRRDREAAEADLKRMLANVSARAGGRAKGGLYISCVARGPNLFGAESRELGILREALGEVPLVGFFANGEISHHRLYTYTGVLTLFL